MFRKLISIALSCAIAVTTLSVVASAKSEKFEDVPITTENVELAEPGLYIDQSVVEENVWYAMWLNNGQTCVGYPQYGYPYYDDETIYFAVKVGWDAQ